MILAAVLVFLGVTLAVTFCLTRNGISFIAVVSTGHMGKCTGLLLLSQRHLEAEPGCSIFCSVQLGPM